MRLLLDTHVVLWVFGEPSRLTPAAAAAIADPANDVFVSAVSVWEMAIKQSIGKLTLPGPVETWLPPLLEERDFIPLPISLEAAGRVRAMPFHHNDPFDRLLVSQAGLGFRLVTHDRRIADYDVPVLWT